MDLGTVLSVGLGGVIVVTVIYYFLTEWNADWKLSLMEKISRAGEFLFLSRIPFFLSTIFLLLLMILMPFVTTLFMGIIGIVGASQIEGLDRRNSEQISILLLVDIAEQKELLEENELKRYVQTKYLDRLNAATEINIFREAHNSV